MKIVCKNADNDTKMHRHFHNKKYKITFKKPDYLGFSSGGNQDFQQKRLFNFDN